MYKTKAITIVFLLLAMVIVSGCSGNVARQSDDYDIDHNVKMNQHDRNERVAHAAWYETESIDIDWPF